MNEMRRFDMYGGTYNSIHEIPGAWFLCIVTILYNVIAIHVYGLCYFFPLTLL